MAIEADKITKTDVLKAIEQIDMLQPRLFPSIRYDLIVNGKHYPPKEVIRIAYKISTGEDLGKIYGGAQSNRILAKLGFEIKIKNSIWKLGCNWGKGAPNFFELLQSNSIVIGTTDQHYFNNDLVIITSGFIVVAIAKVISPMKSVTTRGQLKDELANYQIPFNEHILVGNAEIYLLKRHEVFSYKLQQGIRKVRAEKIIEKVLDIWDNRSERYGELDFHKKEYHEKAHETWKYPCMVLESHSWDDYGYKTAFDLFFYRSVADRTYVGLVKILEERNNTTILPKDFKHLPLQYCSLGQTVDFYKTLIQLFPLSYSDVLDSLRDCATNKDIYNSFKNEEGFIKSLLRSSEAELIIAGFDNVLREDYEQLIFAFQFETLVGSALTEHSVDFSFNTDPLLKNRFFCIVGKNATGKTKFISRLANKLADDNEDGIFKPIRPIFSKIIVSSFSYFDKFRFPKREDTNYVFIGIRKKNAGVYGDEEIASIIWKSFSKIVKDSLKREIWRACIETSLETEFLNFNLEELYEADKSQFIEKTENIFSSGQSIVFQFITRFIESIDFNSILIFDEPETHLHPNIAGRLIRTINYILVEYKSYAIISTHSPVIVQEIPSKFIRIFQRRDNYPIIFKPTIECFGENLSTISNHIFNTDKESELYRETLENLAETKSLKEIDQLFENKLSLNARLFIQSIKK